MRIYLPKSLDEEIASKQVEIKKLQRELYDEAPESNIGLKKLVQETIKNLQSSYNVSNQEMEDSILGFLFGVEKVFRLFGDIENSDAIVKEAIFWSYDPLYSKFYSKESVQPSYESEFMEVARLHTHWICSVPQTRSLIRFYHSNILQNSPEPQEGCKASAYCFSFNDLDSCSKKSNEKWIEVLYCEAGRKYIAINPKMEMVEVIFYSK